MRFDVAELDENLEQLARAYETVAEETRSTPLRQRALVVAAALDPVFCKNVHAKALSHFADKHGKEKRDQGGEGRVLVRFVRRSLEYYEPAIRWAQEDARREVAYAVGMCIAVTFVKQLSYLPILQDLTEEAARHTDPASFPRANHIAAEVIGKALLNERGTDPQKLTKQILVELGCPKSTAEYVSSKPA